MLTLNNSSDVVMQIAEHMKQMTKEKECIIVAVDGRCAAGKTTLARMLKETLSCNVIHMDSFFLRPEQRTEERFLFPGGNVDYERVLQEVLLPLKEKREFSYRPFSCKTQMLESPVSVYPAEITIIEGSYSCHPVLIEQYDWKIFLDIDEKTQRERVLERNPQNAKAFFEKWIPLEEKYIQAYAVSEKCDMYF